MFYSQSLLSKKGPLGNIWIASFCFKRLKKHQIADTDITSSIDKIIPEVQISYRVLAQLLLGVVRIFSKKVDYLYHDCNETLTNLRKSFIPTLTIAQKKLNNGPQHIVHKKVHREPRHSATVANEETHSPEQNVAVSENETLVMQREAMCASYNDVTITLPECFELDAFDLDVVDGGNCTKPHEESILEDEFVQVHGKDAWTIEKDQHSFMDASHHMEVDSHAKYNSGCFTPVNHVILPMMDIKINQFNDFNVEASAAVEESGQQEHQDGQDEMPTDTRRELHFDVPRSHAKQINLHVTTSMHDKESHGLIDENSGARALDDAHNKSDVQNASGLPSPKFAVTTPARKETRRVFQKRKREIVFDETIVLSNGTMKTWIHDASNLVCKRKKAPHTSLDAWRAHRLTNVEQFFMEPVIPYISSEHKAILGKKLPDYSPQKKSTSSYSADAVDIENEISTQPTGARDSLQGRTTNDTLEFEHYSEIPTPERLEAQAKESNPVGISNSALDMMDQELGSVEKESNEQGGGWSTRTMVVAKFLYERFLDLKGQKREENLNLDRILEGRTRANSARFFYETLALKAHGCIDVKQECSYGDIVISVTPQLEALLNN